MIVTHIGPAIGELQSTVRRKPNEVTAEGKQWYILPAEGQVCYYRFDFPCARPEKDPWPIIRPSMCWWQCSFRPSHTTDVITTTWNRRD